MEVILSFLSISLKFVQLIDLIHSFKPVFHYKQIINQYFCGKSFIHYDILHLLTIMLSMNDKIAELSNTE